MHHYTLTHMHTPATHAHPGATFPAMPHQNTHLTNQGGRGGFANTRGAWEQRCFKTGAVIFASKFTKLRCQGEKSSRVLTHIT